MKFNRSLTKLMFISFIGTLLVFASGCAASSSNNDDDVSSQTDYLATTPLSIRHPNAIELLWTPPANNLVTTLVIQRSLSELSIVDNMLESDSAIETVATITSNADVSSASYLDENLTNSSTYYYVFISKSSDGTILGHVISSVEPDNDAPDDISNITITRGNGSIILTWENPETIDLRHIIIKRGQSVAALQPASSFLATSNLETYTDESINHESYYYGFISTDYMGNESEMIIHTADEDTLITIVDPTLKQAVLSSIGKSGDPIYKSDVSEITVLQTNGTISDFTGLEELENIQQLRILNNNSFSTSDLSPIAALQNLSYLILINNNIDDLSILEPFKNIIRLNLDQNNISDISLLSEFENLLLLSLDSNPIADISVLSSLTELRTLYLNWIPLTDISALSSLTNLRTLHLNGSEIESISDLELLTNLRNLYLANSTVSDISALSNLTELTSLYIGNTQVSDISVLSSLTNLTGLNIRETPITTIESLSSLTQLKTLYMELTNVTDIEPLSSLTSLEVLSLDNTPISNFTPLSSLTQLKTLFIRNISGMTAAQRDEIQTALPNTTIHSQ